MAIPLATINRVADELLEKGHIERPYLGLALQPISIPEKLRGNLKAASGLMVVHVEAESPADKAGIVLGDIVVELQGKPVMETYSIRETLHGSKSGDRITAKLLRAGVPKESAITLEGRPAR